MVSVCSAPPLTQHLSHGRRLAYTEGCVGLLVHCLRRLLYKLGSCASQRLPHLSSPSRAALAVHRRRGAVLALSSSTSHSAEGPLAFAECALTHSSALASRLAALSKSATDGMVLPGSTPGGVLAYAVRKQLANASGKPDWLWMLSHPLWPRPASERERRCQGTAWCERV